MGMCSMKKQSNLSGKNPVVNSGHKSRSFRSEQKEEIVSVSDTSVSDGRKPHSVHKTENLVASDAARNTNNSISSINNSNSVASTKTNKRGSTHVVNRQKQTSPSGTQKRKKKTMSKSEHAKKKKLDVQAQGKTRKRGKVKQNKKTKIATKSSKGRGNVKQNKKTNVVPTYSKGRGNKGCKNKGQSEREIARDVKQSKKDTSRVIIESHTRTGKWPRDF